MARGAVAFVALAAAAVVSGLLPGQPLWLRMAASVVTVLVVGALLVLLLGARRAQRPDQSSR